MNPKLEGKMERKEKERREKEREGEEKTEKEMRRFFFERRTVEGLERWLSG